MYADTIIKNKPTSFWPMDSSVLTDSISGVSAIASTPANYIKAAGLVNGLYNSQIVSNSYVVEFPFSGFARERKKSSFSLEAWIYPIQHTNNVSILSHSSVNDGLRIQGTRVYFSTIYSDQTAQCSYDFQYAQLLHVVGVHTPEFNMLYINGDLVSSVEITSSLDFNITNDNKLYMGNTTSGSLQSGPVALYAYALSSDQIIENYNAGINIDPISASSLDISYKNANVFSQKIFSDWNGHFTNCAVSGNTLVPNFDSSGNSLKGQWVGTFAFSTLSALTINFLQIFWRGKGSYSVYYSLDDGLTWQAATNRQRFFVNSNILNKTIDVLILFTGGIYNDDSSISELTITSFSNNVINNTNRNLTLEGTYSLESSEYSSGYLTKYSGALLSSGAVVVNADANITINNLLGLRFWILFNNLSSSFTIFDNRDASNLTQANLSWNSTTQLATISNGSLYVNGALETTYKFLPNVWYHVSINLTSANNRPIFIGRAYNGAGSADFSLKSIDYVTATADYVARYKTIYSNTITQISDSVANIFTSPSNEIAVLSSNWSTSIL